jgi:hypothetical protein
MERRRVQGARVIYGMRWSHCRHWLLKIESAICGSRWRIIRSLQMCRQWSSPVALGGARADESPEIGVRIQTISARVTARTSGGETGFGPLRDESAFELRERWEDVKD